MSFELPKYTWDTDRELCQQCAHLREHVEDAKYNSRARIMRCAVSPFKGRTGIGTCIDNRSRGPCGREGRSFEAKGSVPDVAVHDGGTTRSGAVVQAQPEARV